MKMYHINNPTIMAHFNKLNEQSNDSDSITKSETCSVYDVNLYKKPWIKLNIVHKIIKIKEYVNNLNDLSKQQKIEMKDKFIDLVKTKVLTKKDKVDYDEINGIILNIK
jgi:DNA repair exonuclease SbcCD nuclease subunit